ncbi:SlyX family protein [Azospirillum doebereinerae]|uniref:Protein SlyX homolog n=1 Tax=Azospirillum doebereinerae TaxID=92933 RepID=A0A433J8F0_9PROT|nr:SlyX family protein [Azospirillum doebereinerae]MCG5240389.1 SlyX family protein [Azospirillum doebereinerae]RUQ70256.1 SlyX family protein [Azospirillum doebereinerae]
MDPALEQRLTDLESRVAHHERMAEEMSEVLYEQSRTIDRLTLHLRRLREQMAEVEAGGGRSPQDDRPPPHY